MTVDNPPRASHVASFFHRGDIYGKPVSRENLRGAHALQNYNMIVTTNLLNTKSPSNVLSLSL